MSGRSHTTLPAMAPGFRIGAYTIVSRLGAGGMGEVYRARDGRLGRDVAIKILPRLYTADPHRLARFEREARTLASLSHPHIGAIYGVEEIDGALALLLELIEGDTLAVRIARGPVPLAEAIGIATQIADALDVAHDRGIVHRDLKPANIAITPDGAVKVLDFGLATAAAGDEAGADLTCSPTMAVPGATRAGTVLGTAAYMSPEQARGEVVDKRTDVWAFGCVLYEMLTGRPAFHGDSATEVLANVLKSEPEWHLLPAAPDAIHRLLRRLLHKDPKRRLRDIRDARLELEEASAGPFASQESHTPGVRRMERIAWGGAVAAIALVTSIAAWSGRTPPAPPSLQLQLTEFPIHGRLAESATFSISPDGRHLVKATEGADGVLRLWVRRMSTGQWFPLPGTDVFTIVGPMFWSPDSRVIAFQSGAQLKKVSLLGGAPQTVCDLPGAAVGGTMNGADVILVGNAEEGGNRAGGVMRCPAAGGTASAVTVPDVSQQEKHLFPTFLSDGRRFLYLRVSRARPENSGIYVGELETATAPREDRLIATGFGAAYVPTPGSRSGVIVFARDGRLFAQRFDERRLELDGDAVQVADHLGSYLDSAYFSASAGTLVYRAADPDSQLTWFNLRSHENRALGEPDRYTALALSPDDDRVLVSKHVPNSTADQDLYMFALSGEAGPQRMTFAPTLESWPLWLTNDRFVFGSGGDSGVYEQTVGGRAQLLFDTAEHEVPTSMTADSQVLLYTTFAEPDTRNDVWVRIGSGPSATRMPFLRREFDQGQAQLSPDERWVAYVSNEGGPNEVFVAEFRRDVRTGTVTAGPRVPVSRGGGSAPRWGHNGELFYLTQDGWVIVHELTPGPDFRAAAARRLFQVPGAAPAWGVTRDGERFLFAVPVTPPPPYDVVRDWQAALSN